MRHRRGFSLLELSIVLAIIALVVGAGMGMAQSALKSADRISTQEKLTTIKMALDSHGKTYGYLPCPADATLLPGSASFGRENRNNYTIPGTVCTAVASGIVSTSSSWIGAVPVRTLGLPDSYAADAWGNKLTYAVGASMVATPTSYATGTGPITVRSGTRASYYTITRQRNSASYTSAANSGGLVNLAFAVPHGIASAGTLVIHVVGTVYKGSYTISSIPDTTHLVLAGSTYSATDTGTISWQDSGANAAYVVLSHGADGRGAFPLMGSAIPATKLCTGVGANTSPPPCTSSGTTTCIDIENCDRSDAIFYDTSFNDGANAASYFDDFMVWGSAESAHTATNPALYTAATSSCPTGVCEAWCAGCSINYPGTSTAIPPTGLTDGKLCRKVINSNATTCTAACFWSGTVASGVIPCP